MRRIEQDQEERLTFIPRRYEVLESVSITTGTAVRENGEQRQKLRQPHHDSHSAARPILAEEVSVAHKDLDKAYVMEKKIYCQI